MKGTVTDEEGNILATCADFASAFQEVYLRELAFWSAVNMIGNAVSKCEFKTFRGGIEVKERDYWRWNYSPNNNQDSSAFIHKWIGQLYRHNESLVVERSEQLLVADSFERTRNAVREDAYSNIQVEDLSINTTFKAKNVLHNRLAHRDMRLLLGGLNSAYSTLIVAAEKSYQWGAGRHGKLTIDTMRAGDTDGKWMEAYQQLLTKFVKPFMEGNNGVLPLFNGYEFEEIGNGTYRSQQTTRDIRALIDDVFEITAKAFSIPATLLKGEVEGTEDAENLLLTLAIDPLCKNLQEEIVRKQYGYEAFSRGNYLSIDTSTIKHFDLFSNSASVDKLISSGAFSINDILIAAGRPPIDAPWANQHFITKNYMPVQEMAALEGGESN